MSFSGVLAVSSSVAVRSLSRIKTANQIFFPKASSSLFFSTSTNTFAESQAQSTSSNDAKVKLNNSNSNVIATSHTIKTSFEDSVLVEDSPDASMVACQEDFLNLLRLRPLTTDSQFDTSGNPSLDFFLGESQDLLGFKNLFGGQVLSQALQAATYTVDKSKLVHSLHGNFVVGGDVEFPVRFEVDRLRDGANFSTRRVVAKQKGKTIFFCSASFHKEEPGFEHQYPKMPEVPPPEDLINEVELRRGLKHHLPPRFAELWTKPRPIDVRPVKATNTLNPTPQAVWPPYKDMWIKTVCPLPSDAEQSLHRVILSYASDFYMASAGLLPHSVSAFHPSMVMASLDHSVVFHQTVKVDDWLLYSTHSPIAHGARGFAVGQFYSRDGKLVATVMQEGLIRFEKKEKKNSK